MNAIYKEFKRKFSLSMYKSHSIPMAEMTFTKDFITDAKGDLYPLIEKSGDAAERVERGVYITECGCVKRLFCQFFPFASYELCADVSDGAAGFVFDLPSAKAEIGVDADFVRFGNEAVPHAYGGTPTVIVSCRPGFFDVYFRINGAVEYFHTFADESFKSSNLCSEFSDGYVYLSANGAVKVSSVTSYIDNGVSIADMRPLKYENGDVMYENGKVWFTASARLQEGNYQLIFSWVPGTSAMELCGALFFDRGDGRWSPYIASSLLYHREKKEWYIWTSSFECGHILCCGHFTGDPRYGVNVCDVTMMDKAAQDADISEFAGFVRDEDPDFFYDEAIGKWRFAVCRINPKTKAYSYVFFVSDEPFSGYEYIGTSIDGNETGGSFVKSEGELFFVCGNDFSKTSDYRIYSKDGMDKLKFNYPDGGFRGWGSVIPVNMCGRTRYFFLTFDRHKGSSYNWSYGNVYVFEAN